MMSPLDPLSNTPMVPTEPRPQGAVSRLAIVGQALACAELQLRLPLSNRSATASLRNLGEKRSPSAARSSLHESSSQTTLRQLFSPKHLLACTLTLSLASAQTPAITPIRPQNNILIRPYLPAAIPEIRPNNTPRLQSLIRAGAIYLTAQDAIALAIENNIDLEVARYNPLISDWRLERSQAGGSLPGVPSGASQVGSVAAGQGVAGSQSSAGVQGGNGGNGNAGSSSGSVTQIGPVTQTLDPIIQQSSFFSHTSSPQANSTQSSTSNLIQDSRAYSTQVQQGLLTGGQVTVKGTENYLRENAATDILNPSYAPNLSISFQHALLRGFGVAVNARNITVARINRRISDLNFQSSVISVVTNVLDTYYRLSAAHEDINAKRNALTVSDTLLKNVQRQIELGSVAPPEEITSQNLVVNAKQDVIASQATLDQLEVSLKNLLSRNGSSDPILGPARIVPVDKLEMPATDNMGELADLIKEARAKRVELTIDRMNIESSKVSMLGTRNGILPNLQVIGSASQAGLAGQAKAVGRNGADPYFVGGLGTGVGQVLRRNFPTERLSVFASAPIGNHGALADQTIDELTLRQTELAAVKRSAQIEVDIQNGLIALRQARAQYDAAVKNQQLQKQLLEAEQKKYELGASIPTSVVQIQRDLATAQSTELSSLTSYIRARVTLDRTLGRTLEANHITLEQALAGQVRSLPQ